MEFHKLNLKHDDLTLLKKFLKENEECFRTFRYFEKRSMDCLKNHLVTRLYFDESGNCVGYGHLDSEENVWLGICVADLFQGKGYGDKIMSDLIQSTKEDIFLTVDKENFVARKLYQKYNFEVEFETDKYFKMKRKNNG